MPYNLEANTITSPSPLFTFVRSGNGSSAGVADSLNGHEAPCGKVENGCHFYLLDWLGGSSLYRFVIQVHSTAKPQNLTLFLPERERRREILTDYKILIGSQVKTAPILHIQWRTVPFRPWVKYMFFKQKKRIYSFLFNSLNFFYTIFLMTVIKKKSLNKKYSESTFT